jgi:hypothetical protein
MAMLSAVIDKAPVVTTRTAFSEESIDVNGTPVGLYSVSSGAVQPIVTDGHPPVDGEIALGPAVMRTLGVHVGDLVTANGIQLRCVGVALVPRGLPGESLGHGGIVTTSTAEQLDERAVPTGYLIRTADAADASLLLAYLGDALHGEQVGFEASPEPAQIVEYRNVLATPLALAFSLAALGAAMLIIGVTSTVHRKRREYAVLQAIGTTNRQIVGIIEAQALVSLGLVLLFGLPAGIIVANAAWTTFESRLGTVAGSGRPLAILVGAALLATVLTIAIVLPIGRRNASRRPAVGLRQE